MTRLFRHGFERSPRRRRTPGRVRALVRAVVLPLMLGVAPNLAAAHPHVFVSTGLTLVRGPGGEISGVEVSWRYDALYSLLVLEDMELDDDYDGKLSPAEMARLDGFDQNWIEGYEGDLVIFAAGQKLSLGRPEARGTSFENGQITTRHFRPLAAAGTGPWQIQAYDPTYYTAYDLGLGVQVPEGCEAKITAADLKQAGAILDAALGGKTADPEGDFPAVGHAFADRIDVTCAAGS